MHESSVNMWKSIKIGFPTIAMLWEWNTLYAFPTKIIYDHYNTIIMCFFFAVVFCNTKKAMKTLVRFGNCTTANNVIVVFARKHIYCIINASFDSELQTQTSVVRQYMARKRSANGIYIYSSNKQIIHLSFYWTEEIRHIILSKFWIDLVRHKITFNHLCFRF